MKVQNKPDIQNIYPLTPMQEGMLFNSLANKDSHAYFEQISFDIHHKMDIQLLEKSFNTVIQRHEILRAIYNHKKAKRPIQIILRERLAKVYFEDITIMEEAEKQPFVAEYKSREMDKGFDLAKDLLIKLSVFKTHEETYKLIFSFHHILMDGWCIGIIIKEFFQIYKNLEESKPIALDKVFSYGTYISWLEKQDKRLAREYWQKYLDGYDQQTSVPKTSGIKEMGKYEYNEYFFTLDKELTEGLTCIAQKNNVTFNIVFQALWGIVLNRYNSTEDAVFGAVVSGRPHELPGADKIVGLFINTIPVRVRLENEKAFSSLIKELQLASLESEKFDYFPLAQIQADTELKQGLLDHIVIFENYPLDTELSGSGDEGGLYGYKIDNVESFEQTNYDFNITVLPGKELVVKLSYNTLVYDNEVIKNIQGHMQQAIKAIVSNPNCSLSEINILTDSEEQYILNHLNNTVVEYSKEKTIHQLFEEQVQQNPDNIALIYENHKLTYREMNQRVNQVARVLREKGVKPDALVGIMVERSIEMLVGIMAVLKAGGAYLPIDPEYPADRINYMLDDSKAQILLTQNTLYNKYFADKKNITIINLDEENLYKGDDSNLVNVNISADLAYIIYTSGSTGKPKGVMLEHRNVNNFIKGMTENIDFRVGKNVLCLTTISFDIFVLESLLPLSMGLTIVIGGSNEQKNPSALNEIIVNKQVDIMQVTPSRMKMLLEGRNRQCFDRLKLVLVGGEALPEALKNDINKVYKGRTFNVYGPTETTVWSTLKEVTGDNTLNIGKPIANTQILILDKQNRLQPVGIPGELCIGGDGLARGYYNRPELTAEKFVPNPVQRAVELSEKIYRTGDLARWLPDGNIEFLGRIDHQVKVRGYRIELGEIEAQLKKYQDVKEVVVVASEEQNGVKFLCAYMVCEQEPNIQDIREFLSKRLPDYMIPSYFVQLDKIPLTPNGKIDRKALPKPTGSINTGVEYIEPETELEKKLAEIWSEVLGIEKVGINDNFFNLGGHSISMMQISAKISNQMNVDVSIGDFMNNTTIAQLADFMTRSTGEKTERNIYPSRQPEPDKIHEIFPLTEVQMAYLMGRDEKFEMGGISTHIYMEMETKLDMQRFNIVLNKLIKRHPMMRAIVLPTGQQQILEEVPGYNIELKDLTSLDIDAKEACIAEERQRMSHHIFKSDQWPLFEIKSYKMDDETSCLLVGLDMLIADASSIQIILKEIAAYYEDIDRELPELEFTFRDYIMAQKEFKSSEKFKQDKNYWLSKLEDFPEAPALPLKVDPAEVAKPHFKRMRKTVDKENWDKLKKKAFANKITPSALLASAYSHILGFWSNQQKLAINLTVFNRYPFHKDVSQIIGDFTSVILLDIDLAPGLSFWKRTENVQTTLMNALEHRHYDGVDFIREISRSRNLGNKAAMPVVFTSMLMENKDLKNNSQDEGKVRAAITQTSQVYVDHQATEENGNLVLVWDYVEDLFEEETVAYMFQEYTKLIDSLLEDVSYKIEINESDSELIEKYNDTEQDIPNTTLVDLFMKQVKEVPDAQAVIFKDKSITYRELDERSNRVADYLREKGIGKNDYVGVLAKRCIETIVNVMGIVKARAAYVPVDPEYPEDRRTYIMENSGCKIVLEPSFYEKENLEQYSCEYFDANCHPEDIAYVIYTSGSTGRPKGVVIAHGAASNTIIDINQMFEVNSSDKIIGLSSMCFDLSVYDIFGAFASGAALVIVEDQRDVTELIQIVQENQITIWNSVPAIMDMMVDNVDEDFSNSSLRVVLLSGDWIPIKLPEKIKKHFDNAKVISLGGATEASIWSIYYPINKLKPEWKSIPYGIPMANQNFYVLNFEMELCPIGVEGELYIGGVGVAEGYMNNIERTEAAFINHPTLGRIYKTGDYGVLIHDEELQEVYIEFHGRKDHQVKIRGYRIELGEIENCLLNHEFILNAAVVDKTDARGKKILCAYYVADDEELTAEELKVFLGRHVPEYMIPNYFIELEDIPLTPNGKLDRKALPMPDISIEDTYVAPSTETEKKLCTIWEEVLEVEKVGVNDNFFDIGGNSLTATQLISRVRKEFNINIPLREIFGLSNVKEISRYIDENTKSSIAVEDENLVLMRKGTDENKHLFLIHAGSGEIQGYMGFANNLRPDFNYWGIKADRFDNHCPRNYTIESIAEAYVDKIKKIQPKGPYHLAGWCVGGTTTFEVVRRLEEQGETVEFFTLINSFAPQLGFYEEVTTFSLESEKLWAKTFIDKYDSSNVQIDFDSITDIKTIWPILIDYAYTNGIEETIATIAKKTIPANIAAIIPNFETIDLKGLIYYLNVIRTYATARVFYIPAGKVKTQVYFIEAIESRISNKEVWNVYTEKELIFNETEGTHFSIFQPPNVEGLAEKFSVYFNNIK